MPWIVELVAPEEMIALPGAEMPAAALAAGEADALASWAEERPDNATSTMHSPLALPDAASRSKPAAAVRFTPGPRLAFPARFFQSSGGQATTEVDERVLST